jgi:hypothetical protein
MFVLLLVVVCAASAGGEEGFDGRLAMRLSRAQVASKRSAAVSTIGIIDRVGRPRSASDEPPQSRQPWQRRSGVEEWHKAE